jgi:hypothetical protein
MSRKNLTTRNTKNKIVLKFRKVLGFICRHVKKVKRKGRRKKEESLLEIFVLFPMTKTEKAEVQYSHVQSNTAYYYTAADSPFMIDDVVTLH